MTESFDLRAARIINDLKELAALTSDEKGAQRVAWTTIWAEARNWFIRKAESIGIENTYDSAGNLWLKLEGKSDEAVVIGSHLDSVPNGGWLDGALGVLAGLEILRGFTESGVKPDKTIYVVDWADEEGVKYGYSCLGSSAASGTLNIEEFTYRRDAAGITFKDAIRNYNLDITAFADAHKEFKDKLDKLTAYIELHIEQGPVLEEQDLHTAAVYGTAGVERYYIDFSGHSAHAGSFPIKMRRDAFLAAAASSLEFRKLALKYDAVCTVGEVHVTPDVVTIIPGTCTISLDMRTINADDLKNMLKEAKEIVSDAAAQFGCKASFRKIYSVEPQLFDEKLVKMCREAVYEETGEDTHMYSGPLHDAVEMAKKLPAVMMFAMSKDGISHDKEEDTPIESLKISIRAYLRLADKIISS